MSVSPHDALFRRVFGDPEHARGLVGFALPEIGPHVDLDTLEVLPTAHVDSQLAHRASDLALRVNRIDGRTLWLYVLIEHQRQNDRQMGLRLLGYTVRLWERILRDEPASKRLPEVLPVVIYQGKPPWSAPMRLSDQVDRLEVNLGAELRYRLVDLARLEEPAIGGTALGRLALLMLRLAPTRRLLAGLLRWKGLVQEVLAGPSGEQALSAVLEYAVQQERPDASAEELAEVTRQAEDLMISLADTWRLEGEQKGRLEGEQKGRLEGEQKGRLSAAKTMLRTILDGRRLALTPADEARLVACTNPDELERWARQAFAATTAAEALAD